MLLSDERHDGDIMSLKYEGIQKLRKLRPDWSIGLLSVKSIGNLASLDVDFLAVSAGMATPGFVRVAQEQGKQVFVWTINDRVSLFRPALALGLWLARMPVNRKPPDSPPRIWINPVGASSPTGM